MKQTAYQNLSRYRSELMGLAILWVMLFHAYEFHFYILPLDTFKEFGFAGVDIFILLSAMGLYVSRTHAGEAFSLAHFYRRRALRILPTYWMVVGVYSLWLIWKQRIGWSTMLWSLSTLHYWLRIPDTFNWYVPAILAFYLLSPLYIDLFRRCPYKGLLTAFMFPFSYAIYRLSIPLHLNYTEDFLCRIPAFALGILMGHYLLLSQRLVSRHILCWSGSAVLGIALAYLRITNRFYINPCYIIGLLLVPIVLLYAKGIALLPWSVLHRLLRLLGEASLEIYLLNVIITREFAAISPYLDYGPRHAFYYFIVYSGNLLLGLALHRILGRRKAPQKEPADLHIPVTTGRH